MLIHESLGIIQKKLKAPKGQFNAFGKYKYRSCEDILEALKPVLPEGSAITIQDDLVMLGNRFYVKATASFHLGPDSVSCSAFAREAETKKGMDESQITGSSSSYARKYALNGLLLIDDTKDADTTNKHDGNGSEFITDEQRISLEKIIVEKTVDAEKFLKYMGVEEVATIPSAQFGKALAALKKAKGCA